MIDVRYGGQDGWPLAATLVESSSPRDMPLILLHGGGPDHHMFFPLARRLADLHPVVLPDVRGYGGSVCRDPARHTWDQYVDDVIALMDHLGTPRAILGGAGLGATVTLRCAVAHPARVHAAILISAEDIEDDAAKAREIVFLDAFAARVQADGIEAAWAPIVKDLAPLIATLVRDAIPRSDPASVAATAAIGHDRSFRSLRGLSGITAPTLLFRGMDWRHPPALASELAQLLPQGRLADVSLSADLLSAEDLAAAVSPAIRSFLRALPYPT